MPLPWPEIRDKAIALSREWQDAESERAEAQTFWNEFFGVFGVPLLLSEEFAPLIRRPLRSLGRRDMRGVAGAHEVLAPEKEL